MDVDGNCAGVCVVSVYLPVTLRLCPTGVAVHAWHSSASAHHHDQQQLLHPAEPGWHSGECMVHMQRSCLASPPHHHPPPAPAGHMLILSLAISPPMN